MTVAVILSAALKVGAFVAARVLPALFRTAVAAVVWCFTFIEAHHAAILAALSFLATTVLKADGWLLSAARAGVAYFGASAVAGLANIVRGEAVEVDGEYMLKPLVDIKEVFTGEIGRLGVAWHSLFPPDRPSS